MTQGSTTQNNSSESNTFNRWELVSQLCQLEGVTLFEMELVGGILKVFIEKKEGGIQHTHCAGLSNRILNHTEVEKILPGPTILEVSSPGVNRKLTRPDHFTGAIGERVKISYRNSGENKKISVVGILTTFENGTLVLETSKEKKKELQTERIEIPFTTVTDAKVDFLFK